MEEEAAPGLCEINGSFSRTVQRKNWKKLTLRLGGVLDLSLWHWRCARRHPLLGIVWLKCIHRSVCRQNVRRGHGDGRYRRTVLLADERPKSSCGQRVEALAQAGWVAGRGHFGRGPVARSRSRPQSEDGLTLLSPGPGWFQR